MKKSVTFGVVGAAFFLSGCAGLMGGLGGSDAPNSTGNEVEKKYFVENGAGGFDPTGVLAEYVQTGCLTEIIECPLGHDFFQGKADAKYVALLKDLIKFDPAVTDRAAFLYSQVVHAPEPDFTPPEAMRALALAQQRDVLPMILDSVNEGRLEEGKPLMWEAALDSIWYLGAKDQGIPFIEKVLNVSDSREEFRVKALMILAAWKSDVAVSYCIQALSSDARDEIKRGCIWYLGQFGAKEAVPVMGRFIENFEQDVVHALGKIIDPSAVQLLEGRLKEYPEGSIDRIAYLASLLNQGQEQYWDEFKGYMLGRRPGSEDLEASILEAAVMESVAITNPKFSDQVNEALRAALEVKFEEFRWEPAFYSNAALAHRGDSAAIDALIKELENPKEDVRNKAIDLLGGNYESVNMYFRHRGHGLVADPRTIEAMQKYYGIEGDPQKKAAAVRIMAHVRSMLADQEG